MSNDNNSILFTIPNFETAGSGNALYQLALGLEKKGFTVHIMAQHDRGSLVKKIIEKKLKFHVYPYESKARPLYRLFINSIRLSTKFKAIKPSVIYSYHYSSDYSEPLGAYFAGIPWIYVKKNMSWYGPSQNSWYLRSLLARGINVQNSEIEPEFLYRFSSKLTHIPIGVDTKFFKPTIGKKYDLFTFIHISSLIPVKGIHILLDGYKKLTDIVSEGHQLIIIGPDKSDYIEDLKSKYSSIDTILFTGKKMNIYDYLDKSHCFIQSSINEGRREGAPIALQEAMSMKLIAIGSRVAGINDQLKKFKYLQYNSNNSDELKDIMLKTLKMPSNKRKKIGCELRSFTLKNYSLQSEIQKTEIFLKSLITNHD